VVNFPINFYSQFLINFFLTYQQIFISIELHIEGYIFIYFMIVMPRTCILPILFISFADVNHFGGPYIVNEFLTHYVISMEVNHNYVIICEYVSVDKNHLNNVVGLIMCNKLYWENCHLE
jgi:hypothetical protein